MKDRGKEQRTTDEGTMSGRREGKEGREGTGREGKGRREGKEGREGGKGRREGRKDAPKLASWQTVKPASPQARQPK
jgi:hypothetical protein